MSAYTVTGFKKKKKNNIRILAIKVVAGLVFSILVFFLITGYFVGVIYLESPVMGDGIKKNQKALLLKKFWEPPRKKDIILWQPEFTAHLALCRVSGVAGDTFALPGALDDNPANNPGTEKIGLTRLTIPPRHYFCEHDQKVFMNDSRMWGLVHHDQIQGKIIYIYSSGD